MIVFFPSLYAFIFAILSAVLKEFTFSRWIYSSLAFIIRKEINQNDPLNLSPILTYTFFLYWLAKFPFKHAVQAIKKLPRKMTSIHFLTEPTKFLLIVSKNKNTIEKCKKKRSYWVLENLRKSELEKLAIIFSALKIPGALFLRRNECLSLFYQALKNSHKNILPLINRKLEFKEEIISYLPSYKLKKRGKFLDVKDFIHYRPTTEIVKFLLAYKLISEGLVSTPKNIFAKKHYLKKLSKALKYLGELDLFEISHLIKVDVLTLYNLIAGYSKLLNYNIKVQLPKLPPELSL